MKPQTFAETMQKLHNAVYRFGNALMDDFWGIGIIIGVVYLIVLIVWAIQGFHT